MKILFVLMGMLLTCGLSGAFLIYALRVHESSKKIVLHIGYAYTLIAFYVFYMQFNSASIAAVSTVVLPFLLAVIRWLSRWQTCKAKTNVIEQSQFGGWHGISKEFTYPVAASLVVVLLAAWPYLFSGWGAYWHSGNYDIEDGLNGRDAYINSLILDSRPFDLVEAIGDKSWYDFAKAIGAVKTNEVVDSYKEWFAGDGFRFQYSSLAFWSALFDEQHGIDILLVQAILNLILMAVGIFYLSKYAFSMTTIASTAASVVSVCNTFYLTTFFAGHVGSLMYGALIPALLFSVLVKDDAQLSIRHKLIFGGLIVGAIVFAYWHPLAILSLPLLAYWIFFLESFRSRLAGIRLTIEQNPRILYGVIIGFVIVLSIVLAGLWHVTEGYRLRQDGEYRAWGYTYEVIIVPIFLGLMPSLMSGSFFLGSTLGKMFYWCFIFFSFLMALMLNVIYFKTKVQKNSKFFLIFVLFWIAEYFVFRYFISDSYYLYKFLYVHQFVFVIGIVAYVSSTHSRVIKFICAIILLANLGSVLFMANEIYHRFYNQNVQRYQSLLGFDHALLQKSFVALTGGEGIAVRQTLKAAGVDAMLDPRFADYFIVHSDIESDITGAQFTEIIAETGGLAIKRVPAKNYLLVQTWQKGQEPEQFPSDPIIKNTVFRWMGNGKNDNLGIYVIRSSSANEMKDKFLRICFQKGPSAEGPINMGVSAVGKDVLRKFTLDSGVHCEWIPAVQVINSEQPLVIHSGAKGKSLLPYDDRILLYRVFAIGWSDKPYDDVAMSFFNVAEDIVKDGARKLDHYPMVTLHLGQGWEAYETYAGGNFRWVASSAELVLSEADTDGVANVVLDIEPGPSHGARPMEVEVLDIDGNLVFTSVAITGRNTVVLPLSYRKKQTSVYKLRTKSDNLPIAGDSRILNFRVFKLEWKI